MTTTEPVAAVEGRQRARIPRRLRQLSWSTWRGVLVRSGRNFLKDNCADWAAALTYYGVLALFPSTIVVVALVGLVSEGDRTVDTLIDLARDIGAGSVVANDGFVGVVEGVVNQQSSAKALLSFGLLGALWSASGFIGAFTRASNAIYGVEEGRPFYRLRPLQMGLAAVSLVLWRGRRRADHQRPVAEGRDVLHLGNAPRTAVASPWPVLAGIMMVLLPAVLIAPSVQQPRFRLTVGGRSPCSPGCWRPSVSASMPTSLVRRHLRQPRRDHRLLVCSPVNCS
jgi:membrane protein